MNIAALRAAWLRPGVFAASEEPPPLTALIVAGGAGCALFGAGAHLADGVGRAAALGLAGAVAPSLAWAAMVPALFVVGHQAGGRLGPPRVTRVGLVSLSFMGLALMAALPICWYLELALQPAALTRQAIRAALLAAAGLAAADVMARALAPVEPSRAARALWYSLLALCWVQLAALLVP